METFQYNLSLSGTKTDGLTATVNTGRDSQEHQEGKPIADEPNIFAKKVIRGYKSCGSGSRDYSSKSKFLGHIAHGYKVLIKYV